MDERVCELLDELYDSGRTPEEICGNTPELLPEVRERWQQIRRLEAELDAFLPPESEDSRSEPGSRVTDEWPRIPGYEVEGRLGRGGMGVVYRARHLRLNRAVAIKMAIAGSHAASRERFQREAEAVAALRHPHVVQIYDVGDWEDRPYYAMELVAGGTMAQAEKPSVPRKAAALLLPLAGGVAAAHAAGIIHRDLKPANILLELDGTPKIGDFGLSRRLDDASGLTMDGALIGTPSYMAPEQAAGAQDAVGPPADVYALGAILYELLTGRPPFRGETPAETARQVVHSEPMPPSRLNPRVPRDLEIICLKCLDKDPHCRYPSADALGADLRRFIDGEAIKAKPEGRVGRAWRRICRKPGLSAAAAGAALLTITLAVVSLWLAAERNDAMRRAIIEQQTTEKAAEEDLRSMVSLMSRRQWAEARAALERAESRLGGRASAEFRKAIDGGHLDLKMVAHLDSIRMGLAKSVSGKLDVTAMEQSYSRAFHEFGLGGPYGDEDAVASRIRASNIRLALIETIDGWPVSAIDWDRKDWLLRVAMRAEGERSGWIVEARDPKLRRSRAALERLIQAAPVADCPVSLLLSLADDLRRAGGDQIPFLMRIQHAQPGDFWVNLNLGNVLDVAGRRTEGMRFLQAAIAIRPDAAIGHYNLGQSLLLSGSPGEAVEYLRSSLSLDPSASASSYNLGCALRTVGRGDEAIEQFRAGLRLNPGSAWLHAGLADSLAAGSRDGDALAEYLAAVAIDPRLAIGQYGLRTTLMRLSRPEDAQEAWRASIEAAPKDFENLDGYAEFCLFLSHKDDYRDVRQYLLKQAETLDSSRVAERAGRACLLLPDSGEGTARAAALIDRAIADTATPPPAWARPYFLLAKGLAEYRLGRFEASIKLLQGEAAHVMGPCPLLITAMARHRLGRTTEARESLEAAVRSHDWVKAADNREAWIYWILRREAESTVSGQEPVEVGESRGR